MPQIDIGGASAQELKEQQVQREAKKPTLAQQQRENRSRKAGGEIHTVDRKVAPSRKQEAGAAHIVDRGPKKRWRRAYALPTLQDPPGYTLCYISRHKRHRGDDAGVLEAVQEGWEFVRQDQFPKHALPTQSLTKYGEVIGNDSTVLMMLDNELKAQRDAYYNQRRDAATRAVTRRNPGLPEATRQMPLVEDRNDIATEMPLMRARRAPKPDVAIAE